MPFNYNNCAIACQILIFIKILLFAFAVIRYQFGITTLMVMVNGMMDSTTAQSLFECSASGQLNLSLDKRKPIFEVSDTNLPVQLQYSGWLEGFRNTVQPVLRKPCIKQAPALSKHFHPPPPPLILHVHEGQRTLVSVPIVALSSHSFHQLHKKEIF